MDTQSIIAELEAQRGRLNAAIEALRGQGGRSLTASGKPDGRKRPLPATQRKRIAEALRKRWAERKKKSV